jgi:hypothetical protein
MTNESSYGTINQESSKTTINSLAVEEQRKKSKDENCAVMYPSTIGSSTTSTNAPRSADNDMLLERKLTLVPPGSTAAAAAAAAASIVSTRPSSCLFSFLRSTPVVPISSLSPPVVAASMANPQRAINTNGITTSTNASQLLLPATRYRSAFDPFQKPAGTSTSTVTLNITSTNTTIAATTSIKAIGNHPQGNLNISRESTIITTHSPQLNIPDIQPTTDTEKFTYSTLEGGIGLQEGVKRGKMPYKTSGGGLKLQNELSVMDTDDGTSQHASVNESWTQHGNVVTQSSSTNIELDALASATGSSTAHGADSHDRNHSIMEEMDVNDHSSTTSMSITIAEDVPSLSNEDVEEEPSCGSSTRAGDAEVQETIEQDAMLRRRALLLQILNSGDSDAARTNSTVSSDLAGYASPATIRDGACMSLDRCFASSIAELLTGVEINITNTITTHPQQQQQLRTVPNKFHPNQHHLYQQQQQQLMETNHKALGSTNSPSSSSSPKTPPKKIISTTITPEKLNLTEAKRPSVRRLSVCTVENSSTN